MGVINTTPDSFSDGGRLAAGDPSGGFSVSVDSALRHAERLVREGADILDVGGESTRPGAAPVSAEEELDRVIPVLEAITAALDVPVSVDTSRPEVIRAAAGAGAVLINDVRALQLEGALQAIAGTGLSVCLMHMQGQPSTMQNDPDYRERDVLDAVQDFLRQRVDCARRAGIAAERICIDPGFGFGKTPEHNFRLLKHLDILADMGYPVLVGMSRKSMIGHATGRPVGERVAGSVAAAVVAVMKGATIVRCHDVAETVDALQVCRAVYREGANR
ncbi:MAG: dihydropteroate synthase [Pseudohongiellaceae bacterium]